MAMSDEPRKEREKGIVFGIEACRDALVGFLTEAATKGLDLAGAIKIVKTAHWNKAQQCLSILLEIKDGHE